MAENDLTTISISAKADGVKDAASQLKSLSTQLKKIQDLSKAGIGNEVGKSLQALSSAVSLLSNVRVSDQLPKSINSLGRSLSSFNSKVVEFDLGKLKEINLTMQNLAAIGGGKLPDLGAITNKGNEFPNKEVAPTTVTQVPYGTMAEDAEKLINANVYLLDTVESLQSAMADLNKSTKDAGRNIVDASRRIQSMGRSAHGATSKLGQLWSSMKRIAMYRAMRAAIKAITNAFREGIQNLYQYSTLIDGTFKKSMDTLSTSALYLKNSLGALVAPIVNALAPAIDFLVDKFVALLNVFNEFLAMITGASTWTRAVKYPKEYADNLERAGGAAKELRATLLGFDEINRLDDLKARGGGGGGSSLDYSKMFEEVETTTRSLSEMFDDLLDSGKSKFTLWAAGLAGILSLKLAGGLTGVFGGAAGSTGLLSGFTATMLAAFAGFSLGNWMYQNNIGGVKTFADDLMDAGLGEGITKVLNAVEDGLKKIKRGWEQYEEAATDWGDKVNDFFGNVRDGWKIIADDFSEMWRFTFNPYSYEKGHPGTWTIKPHADLTDFQKEFFKGLGEIGLSYNGNGYIAKITFDTHVSGSGTTHGGGGGGSFGGNGGNGGDTVNDQRSFDTEPEPTPTPVKTTPQQYSYIPAYLLEKKAMGGSVETGDLFIANENGPELIAQVGHKTQVANNDQITESIRLATAEGNAESNTLLRQAVSLLGSILAKDNTVVAEVTTDSITNGLRRQNLRNGRTTVEVG